jgi:hypothetical protein
MTEVISNDQQPITYEKAEEILENRLPDFFKQLEKPEIREQRRLFNFSFISVKILESGDNRPISLVHADTGGETPKEMVTKPLSEWQMLFHEAIVKRASVYLK